MYVDPVAEEKDPDRVVTVILHRRDDLGRLKLSPKGECYVREELRAYLLSQVPMRNWVGAPDPMGYGGRPGSKKFYRLPTQGWITENVARSIMQLDHKKIVLTMLSKSQRIGNPRGTFGTSQLHGQLPGVPIYGQLPDPKKYYFVEWLDHNGANQGTIFVTTVRAHAEKVIANLAAEAAKAENSPFGSLGRTSYSADKNAVLALMSGYRRAYANYIIVESDANPYLKPQPCQHKSCQRIGCFREHLVQDLSLDESVSNEYFRDLARAAAQYPFDFYCDGVDAGSDIECAGR